MNFFKKIQEDVELRILQEKPEFKQMVFEIRAIEDYISANSFAASFNGDRAVFKPISKDDIHCDIHLERLDPRTYGGHIAETNEIIINANVLKENGIAIPNGLHEFTHAVECALSKCEKMYDVDSVEHRCILALKSNFADIECSDSVFGIPVSGRAYVKGSILVNDISVSADQMAFALYRLAPIERFAFAIERERYLKSDPPNEERLKEIESAVDNALRTIRTKFKVYDASYNEICRAIDNAYYSLQANRIPTSDLSAALMYELAATMAIQRGKIDLKQFNKITDYRTMVGVLADHGFAVPGSGVKKYGECVVLNDKPVGLYIVENIKQMSASEQRNNPMAIANAVILYGSEVVPHIKNKDAFAAWYYSNDNPLTDVYMNQIAKYLGKEFSHQSYLEINASRYADDIGDIFVEAHNIQNTSIEERFNSDKFEYQDFSNR